MKKECLFLEFDIKNIYVWTHDTYTKVLGCQIGKKWTSDVHLNNNKLPLMWPKQVIWPLYKFYDLSTHFISNLSIIGDLIRNNVFLDKAYELSTYLFKF